MKKRLLDFLYNVDRAIASLCGAPENAVIHADKLDAADNGQEQ